ncbi:hypothetical protein GCM10028807_17280 [Spirosoma daeguense]
MNKKVVVLNESTGIIFGLENKNVTISEKMAVADAEAINAIYPGVYVDVVETDAKPAKTTQAAQ